MIILVINKSTSRYAVGWFRNQSYDYGINNTPIRSTIDNPEDFWIVYGSTGCIKKKNRYECALNFAKQLLVSSFLYI
jgi:hypothetical protein